MKVIDLLNKIAKGEEVPKKIKYTWFYEWSYDNTRDEYCYMQKNGDRFDSDWLIESILNDEIEILEEVEDKEYEDIEEITDECSIWEEQANDIDYIFKSKINTLIRNQKYILEEIKKLKED
mgnify:CR=1 FL=1